MPTLKDQVTKLTEFRHRLAVWEAIHHLMDEGYLPKDGKRGNKGIRVPNCPVDIVPEETIEDVLKNISEGPISDLKKKIEEIENLDVIIREAADNG